MKIASADFETTTKEEDCRVWHWGICDIENIENFHWGTNINDFFTFCEKQKVKDCYFHNLKFDGNFIIWNLLNNGFVHDDSRNAGTFNCVITKTNIFYVINVFWSGKGKHVRSTRFMCSMKKLPFRVEKIAKDFGYDIQKLEIDYHKERPIGYQPTEQEVEYLKHDVQIVAKALQSQFEQGLCKMTNGSDALNDFKTMIGKDAFSYTFPILDKDLDAFIRKSYKGGWTYVNKRFQAKDLKNGLVYDVNSLYPSVMYDRLLPYDLPVKFDGAYVEDTQYPLYIQHFWCEFKLKEGYLPTVQCKNSFVYAGTEYIEESVEPTELFMTNIDYELFLEHYDVFYIAHIDGIKFKGVQGIFKDYIDKWIEVKNNNTGAIKQWAKLMLNSLYGKYATNPDVTSKYPVMNENNIVEYKLKEEEERDPVYTAMGSFITAYARDKTIRTAQCLMPERFVYADTDSVHILGKEIPKNIDIDEKRLGAWKLENGFERARFLRPKTYIEEENGKVIVKGAGMSDAIKDHVTWENFHIGFKCDLKLKPKNVVGGVILVNTPFEIKD